MTLKQRLPHGLRWLDSDEWNYFVLPDVLFAALTVAFLAFR